MVSESPGRCTWVRAGMDHLPSLAVPAPPRPPREKRRLRARRFFFVFCIVSFASQRELSVQAPRVLLDCFALLFIFLLLFWAAGI